MKDKINVLNTATPEENLYLFGQSTKISGKTAFVGYLRGDFDKSGNGFYTTWFDDRIYLKTDEFKSEFDTVINGLRSDKAYGGLLENLSSMQSYCHKHKEGCIEQNYSKQYGFRLNTDKYAYLIRCNPINGDYSFYVYAYVKQYLDSHMKKAEKGIRFIDSRYNQLFRIADGGRIKLEYPDGKSDIKICRFIDEYHVEVGITLFHICEFAERMEKNDVKYTPAIPALPDFCYSTLPSTGELIQIKFGTHGYSSCTVPPEWKGKERKLADQYNVKLNVTKQQEAAMIHGSKYGWNTPGTDFRSYNKSGKQYKDKNNDRER